MEQYRKREIPFDWSFKMLPVKALFEGITVDQAGQEKTN